MKHVMHSAFDRIRTLIGLTGAMGSGKSLVAGYLGRLGAQVIDADKICHDVLRETAVINMIERSFGKSVLCGKAVDRKKLAQIVFRDRRLRKRLEGIVHGPIIKKIRKIARSSKKRFVVVDAPVLIETGLHREMDIIIVVKASRKKCIKRGTMAGFKKTDIVRRVAAQLSLKRKCDLADFVIDNDGTKSEARKRVLRLWKILARND